MKTTVVITGAAGFIGSSLAQKLSHRKSIEIIGIDNFYPNYNVLFKKDNLSHLRRCRHFYFYPVDICSRQEISSIFKKHLPSVVIHLAALTGIRNSLQKPHLYQKVNEEGTRIVFEEAARNLVKSFIFSSSSSVYGNSKQIPFQEDQQLAPCSPYAKTKMYAESILKTLHAKHTIPTIILRLFSVYGPKGRPDMAPYLFTEAAFKGKKITQYGDGNTARDYTYIDDVVNAMIKCIAKPMSFEIINVGDNHPISLITLIDIVEKLSGKKVRRIRAPRRQEESIQTWADISKAKRLLGWQPKTQFSNGMKQFVEWFTQNRLKST